MLKHIPTHLVAGPLGAGKTSLIRHLLTQRPQQERWAVLVNEFGQIGLDAALLHTADAGITLTELPGGCLCCVNGAPLQVALVQLLRKAKPQRLFIEPSGLGHPATLLKQLTQAPWQEILAVQPAVMVVDAQRLANGECLPEAQREALPKVGLLILNKSESLSDRKRQELLASLPNIQWEWTQQGRLPFNRLPGSAYLAGQLALETSPIPTPSQTTMPALLLPGKPLRQIHEADGRFAVGWRFHHSWQFDRQAFQKWLDRLPALLRAKAILHSDEQWWSFNQADTQGEWRVSEWRKDSRVELIFDAAVDAAALESDLTNCTQ
jgi:G3E family GTPase